MLHDFCEAVEGVFGAAQKGVHAGHIIENGGFFGIDGQRAAGPVKTSSMVANASEHSRAQVESAWVVGGRIDVPFGQFELPLLGSCGFLCTAQPVVDPPNHPPLLLSTALS